MHQKCIHKKKSYHVHPSIYSLTFCLSVVGSRGSWSTTGTQTSPVTPAPPGISQGIPRSDRIYNPSSEFRLCPRASSQWDENRKHHNQKHEPPQLISIDVEEQWVTELFILCHWLSPAASQRKLISTP